MKKIIVATIAFVYSAIALTACNNPNDSSTEADNTDTMKAPTNVNVIEAYHYVHTEGKTQQDSTIVVLIVDGNKVDGSMEYIPAEKDARRGKLSGTIENGIVNAQWVFMQEGMTDSIPVSFKQEEEKLLQKTWAYDAKTGKEYLPDTAQYSIEYKRDR